MTIQPALIDPGDHTALDSHTALIAINIDPDDHAACSHRPR